MPRVEVEPVIIEQPEHLSRQQRRAAERKALKELEARNKKIALQARAKQLSKR